MTRIILQGRGAIKGIAEGRALVCPETIMGWNGIDAKTGLIIEKGHPLEGACIKGAVLILPGSKGSNGWSMHFHAVKIAQVAPAAMVFTKLDSKAAVASVVLDIPVVTDLEEDPFAFIKTGNWVKVDGNEGIVEITER
ncbi:aconitase X swivel domain-containing protein [Candidatus Formimonas warabiya]|uniref:Phosphomevalonate dehydratase small subunit-like domain-containing protein n=1 Tax=Formimonas warabiya TaxID=1761012 RepID=A0A3G1KRP0_FORW1|nr:DUF126 domain-containing protein [Candidatus Formimonas warabiya]ATW25153.1 hypothetical protein DCMF_10575 [Candidatus Formimonas warabiya]